MNGKAIKSYILAAFFTVLALAGCARKPRNPIVEALVTAVVWASGADEDRVYITKLEQLRKVTVGEELDYRISLFEYKLKRDTGHYLYYKESNMPRNAARFAAWVAQDNRILASLDSLRMNLDDGTAARVAFYEFKFSAKAESPDYVFNIKDWHFIITPRYKILAMKQNGTGIRRGMGKLIPGYMTVLGHEEMTEEDMERQLSWNRDRIPR